MYIQVKDKYFLKHQGSLEWTWKVFSITPSLLLKHFCFHLFLVDVIASPLLQIYIYYIYIQFARFSRIQVDTNTNVLYYCRTLKQKSILKLLLIRTCSFKSWKRCFCKLKGLTLFDHRTFILHLFLLGCKTFELLENTKCCKSHKFKNYFCSKNYNLSATRKMTVKVAYLRGLDCEQDHIWVRKMTNETFIFTEYGE